MSDDHTLDDPNGSETPQDAPTEAVDNAAADGQPEARTPSTAVVVKQADPPASFTEAEAEIWRDAMNAITNDWIGPESYPQLMAYCRHSVYANQVAAKIQLFETAGYDPLDPTILKELRGLYKDFALHTEKIASLATKLKISNSSTISRNVTKDKMQKGASLRDFH